MHGKESGGWEFEYCVPTTWLEDLNMRPLVEAFPDVYSLKHGVRPGITKITFSPPPAESLDSGEPETEPDSSAIKVRARVGL